MEVKTRRIPHIKTDGNVAVSVNVGRSCPEPVRRRFCKSVESAAVTVTPLGTAYISQERRRNLPEEGSDDLVRSFIVSTWGRNERLRHSLLAYPVRPNYDYTRLQEKAEQIDRLQSDLAAALTSEKAHLQAIRPKSGSEQGKLR